LYVNQLPVASAGGDRIANVSEHLHLSAEQTIDYDGARDTLAYSWEADDGVQKCSGTACEVFFTTPGTHRVTLTVSDGHENATATVMIEVLPDPPRQIAP